MLKVFLVVAVLTLTASPAASAQRPVEIEDTASGQPCDATALGRCSVELATEHTELLVQSLFFEVRYVCDIRVELALGSDGRGGTNGTVPTFAEDRPETTGNCAGLVPCQLPWRSSTNHHGTSVSILISDICVDTGLRCQGRIRTRVFDTGGEYSLELNDDAIEGESFPRCELDGDGGLRDSDGVQIHHR